MLCLSASDVWMSSVSEGLNSVRMLVGCGEYNVIWINDSVHESCLVSCVSRYVWFICVFINCLVSRCVSASSYTIVLNLTLQLCYTTNITSRTNQISSNRRHFDWWDRIMLVLTCCRFVRIEHLQREHVAFQASQLHCRRWRRVGYHDHSGIIACFTRSQWYRPHCYSCLKKGARSLNTKESEDIQLL